MSLQINLYNPSFRKQKRYFSAAAMLQALAAVAAGIVAMYAFEAYQIRTLERVFAESDGQLTTQRDQLLQLGRELAGRASDKGAAEQLARAEERLQARRSLLNEVRTGGGGNAAGFSGYLAALARRATPGLWLTGIEVGKSNDLVLRGRVLQSELVPLYIKRLREEEPFAGRTVSELRLTARGEAQPAQPSPAEARAPRNFVEFYMSLPL
jgi:hypothetical protein